MQEMWPQKHQEQALYVSWLGNGLLEEETAVYCVQLFRRRVVHSCKGGLQRSQPGPRRGTGSGYMDPFVVQINNLAALFMVESGADSSLKTD
jgi:hypothetical protein